MKFTKMHGLGNDYIYVNCFEEEIADRSALAIRVSNRHFGVGSDGLICICPSERADFLMDMYNADGSRSEMCGNGIRCVGKYVYDKGLTKETVITVESGGEVKTLQLFVEDGRVQSVRVDMGQPILKPELIPVNAEGEVFIDRPVEVLGQRYLVTCVSMGNPHAVTFVEDVDSIDIQTIGPVFESHPLFPERVNTEFAQVIDGKTLKMRVWERGSGETLACGTGASACVVAGSLNGLCESAATVQLLGGELEIEWDKEETGCVFMTGPAVTVFDGELF
ncbi:MAG: diaminopimelate epimerase [Oscillospiraceae bacterium]|nr:diaminopimelate epimerase [Oscillospiraceae bacterium]